MKSKILLFLFIMITMNYCKKLRELGMLETLGLQSTVDILKAKAKAAAKGSVKYAFKAKNKM